MVRPHHYEEQVKQPAVQKRSLFKTSNEGRRRKEEAMSRKMNEETKELLRGMENDSDLFHNHTATTATAYDVPRFETNEIELETTVGMGEFGIIHKVDSISCCFYNNNGNKQSDIELIHQMTRQKLAQHFDNTNSNHHNHLHHRRHHLRKRTLSSGALSTGANSTGANSTGTLSATTLDTESSNSTLLDHRMITGSEGSTNSTPSSFIEVTYNNNSNATTAASSTEHLVGSPYYATSGCANTNTSNVGNSVAADDNEASNSDTATTSRNGSSMFVIKHIRKDLYPNKKIEAAKALAREAKILSRLQELYCVDASSSESADSTDDDNYNSYNYIVKSNHPNLISLRGTVSDPGTSEFGIILDRLNLTLTEIATSWNVRQTMIIERYSGTKHPYLVGGSNNNDKKKTTTTASKLLLPTSLSSPSLLVSSSSSPSSPSNKNRNNAAAAAAATSSKQKTKIIQSTLLPQHRRERSSIYATAAVAQASQTSSSWFTEVTNWFTSNNSSLTSKQEEEQGHHHHQRNQSLPILPSRSSPSSSSPRRRRQQQQQQQQDQQYGQRQQQQRKEEESPSPSPTQKCGNDHTTNSTGRRRRRRRRIRSTLSLETSSGYSPESILLLGERVLALYDVSEGMKFLHEHRILFRDLKTENICSCSGASTTTTRDRHHQQRRMQIFDFGLAKECKSKDRVFSNDSSSSSSFYDTYRMTGMTGTLRIMAPEVIQCAPYGLPADVFSFGMCMWEVFEGTKCNFLSPAEICSKGGGVGGGARIKSRSNYSNDINACGNVVASSSTNDRRRRRRASLSTSSCGGGSNNNNIIRPPVPSSYFNDIEYEYDDHDDEDHHDAQIDDYHDDHDAAAASAADTATTATRHYDSNNIGIGMPKQLQRLLKRCWSDDTYERPTFEEIGRRLKLLLWELYSYHDKNNNNNDDENENETKNRNKSNTYGDSSLNAAAARRHKSSSSLAAVAAATASSSATTTDVVAAANAAAEEAFWNRLETIYYQHS